MQPSSCDAQGNLFAYVAFIRVVIKKVTRIVLPMSKGVNATIWSYCQVVGGGCCCFDRAVQGMHQEFKRCLVV